MTDTPKAAPAVLEADAWFYAKGGKSMLVPKGAEHPGKDWAESPADHGDRDVDKLKIVAYDGPGPAGE